MTEPVDGIRRRLQHILGAHADSPMWFENQIRQALRWLDEWERRNSLSTAVKLKGNKMQEPISLKTLEMGRSYKDNVTGLTGALIGKATFMDSGDNALLQPLVGSDGLGGNGKLPDCHWVSLNRLEAV